jgi:hypothetical protein
MLWCGKSRLGETRLEPLEERVVMNAAPAISAFDQSVYENQSISLLVYAQVASIQGTPQLTNTPGCKP